MLNLRKVARLVSTIFLLPSAKSFVRINNHFSTNIKLNMKKDSYEMKSLSQYYKPKGENQQKYVRYLNDYKTKILFVVGPAGTGKTMFACNSAIQELKSGNINKIVLTRPVVPVEEDIGFLPGNINKKMDPWTRPIFDIFLEFFSQKDIDSMVYNNIIEISPLAYMRGRTFKKSFIIADEMQNSSPNQMLMLTTRIGEGSKMVVTGDLNQSDKGLNSGLSDFIKKYKLYDTRCKLKQDCAELYDKDFNIGIKIVELNNTDIERSPVVAKILEIYASDGDSNNQKSINYESVKSYRQTTTTIYNNDAALIPIEHMTNRSIVEKNTRE
jgi:phosphate starvation-inducible PhoH-like protein